MLDLQIISFELVFQMFSEHQGSTCTPCWRFEQYFEEHCHWSYDIAFTFILMTFAALHATDYVDIVSLVYFTTNNFNSFQPTFDAE